MRWFVCFLVISLGNVVSASELRTDLQGRQLIVHYDGPLDKKMQRLAKNLRSLDFFAATALNTSSPTPETTGFVQNFHSLQNAQAAALRYCREKASNADDCTLWISVVPRNYDTSKRRLTLSKIGIESYKAEERWSNTRRSNGEYRAIAISETNLLARSATRPTPEDAQNEALSKCKQRVAQIPAAEKTLLFGTNSTNCRLIRVFGTE